MLKAISTCTILILLATSVYSKVDGEYCYALALEGGGDKGAYQAGALAQIIEDSDADEIQYDVVSGVSVGSINAGFLAGFSKGQELEAVEEMLKNWEGLTSKNIYKDWPWGGPVRGIFNEKSLYDSSPFREYITKALSPPKRGIIVSATNAATGVQKTWDETTEWSTLLKAIDASSSFPGFFTPVTDIDEGVTYYDGGVSYSVNIFGAINKCVDRGFDYNHIVIDVIMCTGATVSDKNISNYRTLPMVLRYLEIERYFDSMELLERALYDFTGVNFRYLVAPTEKIEPGLIPMDFDHKQIMKMIEIGRSDAKKAMKLGHGKNFKNVLAFHDKKMNGKFSGGFGEYLKIKNEN